MFIFQGALNYCMAMIKACHNGGILACIMHTGRVANMLMWQRIKEERGVRVTSVHACIGKHIFFVKNDSTS